VFVVRYVALVALVVWVGGTLRLLAELVGPSDLPPLDALATVCGAVMVACLVIMKFVGPPPAAFPIRAGVGLAMTTLALSAGVFHRATTAVLALNVLLGFVLLAWYARE